MKIGIIGGGIVGSVLAFYLSQNHQVTIYDDGQGQATQAAAGIICPWFSKRRNKKWYRLANVGAHFFPDLVEDLKKQGIESQAYQAKPAWLLKKDPGRLDELMAIAEKRKEDAPLIGYIHKVSPAEQKELLPFFDYDQDVIQIDSGAAVVNGADLCRDLQTAGQRQGLIILRQKAQLTRLSDQTIQISQDDQYDLVILAAGAWLKDLLQPWGYQVDIRPQKGQLAVYHLGQDLSSWPIIMPEGTTDIIPHNQGELYVGATHEDNQGFDLRVDMDALTPLLADCHKLFPALKKTALNRVQVGTRAYTSDFAPFYGPVPGHRNVYAISGLGSSGLTTGPIMAREVASMIDQEDLRLNPADYSTGPYIQQ